MVFSNNPYRILGVLSNSGVKEVKKNLSKLKAFAKIGKEMKLDYNFSCFNFKPIERSDDLLMKSENYLNLDINKVKSSLFWFTDFNSIDSVAIANLVKNDIDKSREIWEKATKTKKITEKNYSSFNNYSSFLLMNSLDESKEDLFKKDENSIADLKLAFQLKLDFINSVFFSDFNQKVLKTEMVSAIEIEDYFTETILNNLKKNFKSKDLFKIFDGFESSIIEKLKSSLSEKTIQNINNEIENALDLLDKDTKQNISKNKKGSPNGIEFGIKLIKDTTKDFNYLKEIFSSDDFQFQIISDKLSNAILECGIACFNSNIDNNYYQTYYDSFKYSLKIAIGEKTTTRAKKAIKHCEDEASANICAFCKLEDVTTSFRVKMHKMKWDNSYTYFKDGGVEIHCCTDCKSEKMKKKYIAWITAAVVYVLAIALSQGILFAIDLIFAGFKITKWWFNYVKKEMYYKSLESHPVIKILLADSYKFGMP